jgi:hypothetical protein
MNFKSVGALKGSSSHDGGRARRADIPVCQFRRLSSRRNALAGLESLANRQAESLPYS